MLAPNQVSAPAAIQTSSMPLNDGTALLTSEGWTKIDDPTIVPTTIAVAWVNPIVRASLADTARIVSVCTGSDPLQGVRPLTNGETPYERWPATTAAIVSVSYTHLRAHETP